MIASFILHLRLSTYQRRLTPSLVAPAPTNQILAFIANCQMLFVGPATSLAASLTIATGASPSSIDLRPSLQQSSVVIAAATADPPATTPTTVPALQIIVAYGKLAGRTCYGSTSPPGSSCQLPLSDLEHELGLDPSSSSSSSGLTRGEFKTRLNNLPFQWPLKPYGRDSLKKLSKTAVVNKGAETAIYMDELERRGLYDRRNPTGPLPTNLRPEMNKVLEKEGLGEDAVDVVFDALVGDAGSSASAGGEKIVTREELKRVFGERDAIDYYGFLELVGNNNINWPRYWSPGDETI